MRDEERSGRPLSAVTERSVLAVKNLIEEYRRITYKEIQHILQIGSGSIHDILYDHLRVRRIVSHGVPHNRADAQKHARKKWCRDMIAKFEAGSSQRVYDIITGDKSWPYQDDPETKDLSTIGCFKMNQRLPKLSYREAQGRFLQGIWRQFFYEIKVH